MQFEPKDLFEKLEFDKILQLVKRECIGSLGEEAVMRILPDTSRDLINLKLKQVVEMKTGMETNERLPLNIYEDISEDTKVLSIVDFVLPIEGLLRIHKLLLNVRDVFKYFTNDRKESFPNLFGTLRNLRFDEDLAKAIDRILDEEGNIRSDASPAFAAIRRGMMSKRRELDKQFKFLINNYKKQGWLTDNVESFRNGRRVLSVPSEHKRKIRGIIHDESATGKTAFIEPEQVIQINNDIFEFETEEKREIYRLLKDLSATLRPYVDLLESYQNLLVLLDVIQAKARMALLMDGVAPKIRKEIFFGIWQGNHPILYLKNKQLGKETVPFDLTLLHDNRILVVSGPNAGGKSVFMKAVGLLQLMLQSGMLIPVRDDSEMGIFNKIFADIGDQQSLEDDLSTYSSRLENMRKFMEKADSKSLVLIDEFGSGTDPKIGGAIAEAILHELQQKSIFSVITTHYSNLKTYAFKTKGIINGAMRFDKDNLAPTYELLVGRPGSSYAFEIAQKAGLPKSVIKYARHRAGKNERAVDELLIDLQKERQDLIEKLQTIGEQESKLQRLINTYESLHSDLEYRRKKIKLDAKEQSLQETARDNKEMERLIREIKEEKNLEKAKKLAEKVRKEKKALVEEVTELKEKVYYEPTQKAKALEIEVGHFVKMRTGGSSGEVESIHKGKAIVKIGALRMTIPMRDLIHAKEPLEVNSSTTIKTTTTDTGNNFETKLDIRGLRLGDALLVVQDFVDQALISNSNVLRIIHGKGNGVLRKAVKHKLREYKAIQSIYHPENEFGGDGVTIVEL